jgi:hypothetical protein
MDGILLVKKVIYTVNFQVSNGKNPGGLAREWHAPCLTRYDFRQRLRPAVSTSGKFLKHGVSIKSLGGDEKIRPTVISRLMVSAASISHSS